MTFSQYAGIAIVPTLSRIVLFAVFFTAGYNKWFTYADFTALEAATLKKWGLNPTLQQTALAEPHEQPGRVVWAAYRQEATDLPPGTLIDDVTGQPQPRPQDDAATAPAVPPTTAPSALQPGIYRAQSMHKVTLMLDKAGWPQPAWQARLLAFTELVGGSLLLIGLFSRVWGVGLAIAMGMAFYLTTMQTYFDIGPLRVGGGMGPLNGAIGFDNFKLFNTVFVQLGLFVLAFGVFLTGPGPLSFDRILFGGRREVVEVNEAGRR